MSEVKYKFTCMSRNMIPFTRKKSISEELTLKQVIEIALESWAEKAGRELNTSYAFLYDVINTEPQEALKADE